MLSSYEFYSELRYYFKQLCQVSNAKSNVQTKNTVYLRYLKLFKDLADYIERAQVVDPLSEQTLVLQGLLIKLIDRDIIEVDEDEPQSLLRMRPAVKYCQSLLKKMIVQLCVDNVSSQVNNYIQQVQTSNNSLSNFQQRFMLLKNTQQTKDPKYLRLQQVKVSIMQNNLKALAYLNEQASEHSLSRSLGALKGMVYIYGTHKLVGNFYQLIKIESIIGDAGVYTTQQPEIEDLKVISDFKKFRQEFQTAMQPKTAKGLKFFQPKKPSQPLSKHQSNVEQHTRPILTQ